MSANGDISIFSIQKRKIVNICNKALTESGNCHVWFSPNF